MTTAVHVTHEAIQKIGGIGTVLQGLITASAYQKSFPKTLLYSPMFTRDGDVSTRLGPHSEVVYSSLDEVGSGELAGNFSEIEREYGISIAYGHKSFKKDGPKNPSAVVDIVAVDIWHMKVEVVEKFKFLLWERFDIDSSRFESDSDYEQYLRIALPLIKIIEALYGTDEPTVLFSHEYMGMASALALMIERQDGRRKGDTTIFYAHEISTARAIVEKHIGHDFTFYNTQKIDREMGVSMEGRYGSYSRYSRNELVKRAALLDYIFAVSDITKEEYLYLKPDADQSRIEVVYNGINAEQVKFADKKRAIKLTGDYCETLFNFRPDYIFTHVARLVISKGMWRDTRILYFLDEHFRQRGLKGFFILLSSQIGYGRHKADILKMESEYGWPVLHREGWPDLSGDEVDLYRQLEIFNSRSIAIKGIFINQFGFNRSRCGMRIPEEISFFDLRLASDMEFGMSIYEPFGIAQLETFPYGGRPVITEICGCACCLKNTIEPDLYIAVDSTKVPEDLRSAFDTAKDYQNVSQHMRDQIETAMCKDAADTVLSALPKNERDRKSDFERMQEESRLLDWEHVAAKISKICT